MRNSLLIVAFILSFLGLYAQEVEINGCHVIRYYTYDKGSSHSFYAYGNVYVETDPTEIVDLKVKVIDSEKMCTYRVYRTTDTPKECGEWRFVTDRSKAKFTIRYVKDWEDCTICFIKDRSNAGF